MKVKHIAGKRACLVMVLAGCAGSAQAAFSTVEGGTGLMLMRGPDIMPRGDIDSSIFVQYDTFKDPITGLERSDFRLSPSLSRALTDRFEAGLSMPYFSSSSLNAYGIQGINGFFNWRFAGRRSGLASSFSGYTSIFSARSLNGVGSGSELSGGALNVGYIGSSSGLYLSIGRGQVDRPLFTFTPAVSRSWARLYETSAALGVEYHAWESRFGLSLEVKGRRDDSDQSTTVVAPALRFKQSDHVTWTLGAAVDVTDVDYSYQPKTQVFAAVSVNSNVEAQRRRARSISEVAKVQPEPPVAEPEVAAAVESVGEPLKILPEVPAPTPVPSIYVAAESVSVAEVPMRVPAAALLGGGVPAAGVKPVAATRKEAKPRRESLVGCYDASNYRSKCGLQVEVVNSSGRYSAGEAVAKRLRAAGYNVIRVLNEAGSDSSPMSWIRYRPGLAGDAVSVGHALPHNQIVSKDRTLPNDVAVRVVVGTDLR